MIGRSWFARVMSCAVLCSIVALPLQSFGAPPEGRGKDKTRHEGKSDQKVKSQNKADDKGRHVGQDGNRGKPGDDRGKHGQNKPGDDRGRHIGQTDNRGKHLGQIKNKKPDARAGRYGKNDDWGEIAKSARLSGALGKLRNDRTLYFSGRSGALYSVDKHRTDLKSKSQTDRLRATYFSKTKFYRDGRRYDRVKVTVKQKTYYRFVRR